MVSTDATTTTCHPAPHRTERNLTAATPTLINLLRRLQLDQVFAETLEYPGWQRL